MITLRRRFVFSPPRVFPACLERRRRGGLFRIATYPFSVALELTRYGSEDASPIRHAFQGDEDRKRTVGWYGGTVVCFVSPTTALRVCVGLGRRSSSARDDTMQCATSGIVHGSPVLRRGNALRTVNAHGRVFREQRSRVCHASRFSLIAPAEAGDGARPETNLVFIVLSSQGASALLPRLRAAYAPENCKEDVDPARVYQESGKGPGRPDDGTTVAVAGDSELASTRNTADGVVTEAVVDDAAGAAEEWEMADDRMEACLQGGVSLTSLDVSSPWITASFVEM